MQHFTQIFTFSRYTASHKKLKQIFDPIKSPIVDKKCIYLLQKATISTISTRRLRAAIAILSRQLLAWLRAHHRHHQVDTCVSCVCAHFKRVLRILIVQQPDILLPIWDRVALRPSPSRFILERV